MGAKLEPTSFHLSRAFLVHPLVAALTDHTGDGLERAVLVGEVDSTVSILHSLQHPGVPDRC